MKVNAPSLGNLMRLYEHLHAPQTSALNVLLNGVSQTACRDSTVLPRLKDRRITLR